MATEVTKDNNEKLTSFRRALNILLFEVNTPIGKVFNVLMLSLIALVVFVSMIKTISDIREEWIIYINAFEEWVLIAFLIEYVARVYASRKRWDYISSFNGIIDLVTVLPLLLVGNSYVLVRLLRLTRVIRVAISIPVVRALFASLKGSIGLLTGVLMTIALISILVGNIIYILEPMTFANAFEGTWWSLVTMSTVGYGDFIPHTAAGKIVAACLIMAGICMFSMVTAVISVKVGRMINNVSKCSNCQHRIAENFLFCPHCAEPQMHENDFN